MIAIKDPRIDGSANKVEEDTTNLKQDDFPLSASNAEMKL
jgi:hypothetical protein